MRKLLDSLKIWGFRKMHDTHEVGSSNLPSPTTHKPHEANGLCDNVSIVDAYHMYMDACGQRNLRNTSLMTYKTRLTSFLNWTDCKTVDQITRQDVKRFAESFDGRWSRIGHRNDVCGFLNWCGDQGFCSERKFTNVKILEVLQDENPIEILSVDQAKDLLDKMPDKFKGRTAIQLFAGVRPYESLKIESKDLDFQGKKLYILGANSKLRTTRVLHDLPNNLLTWLRKYGINKTYTYNAYRIARRRYFGRIAHDAMRHTFCTYAYFTMGMEQTMRYTGHSNYKTFHRHYCSSVARKQDAVDYFNIMP